PGLPRCPARHPSRRRLSDEGSCSPLAGSLKDYPVPSNILIASWGGAGHLGPMLTAAGQLRRHRHRVRFIARPDARTEVEAAGSGFVAWQRVPSFSPIAHDRDGLRYAYDHLLFGPASARAADTRAEIERAPTDALLADSALFGCALAAEA